MSERVIHVAEISQFPDAVYIGRKMPKVGNSIWANHYRIGLPPRGSGTREMVIEKYRKYLLATPNLIHHLPELRDKTLACWCRHSEEDEPPCHADVLIELLGKHSDEELRAWE